jgi:hypothetical protein
MKIFKTKTVRCEWQVVIQPVDQYGMKDGKPTLLDSWPTAEEAYADLSNHGIEHEFVKGRWIPFAFSGYEYLQVQYREREIVQI